MKETKNKKFKFEYMNTEEFMNYLSSFGFPEPEIVTPENAGVFFNEIKKEEEKI